MHLLIRQAQPGDAAGIVAVLNPIIEAGTYTVLDTPLTVEFERKYIVDFPERGIFHVAARGQDHNIVGLQSLEPFASYTHAFDHVGVIGTYVALPHQRHGVGTCLSRATFDAARRLGYRKIMTYIRVDNLASVCFHLKLGFRLIGTVREQARIGDRYVDEIMVEMFL